MATIISVAGHVRIYWLAARKGSLKRAEKAKNQLKIQNRDIKARKNLVRLLLDVVTRFPLMSHSQNYCDLSVIGGVLG